MQDQTSLFFFFKYSFFEMKASVCFYTSSSLESARFGIVGKVIHSYRSYLKLLLHY